VTMMGCLFSCGGNKGARTDQSEAPPVWAAQGSAFLPSRGAERRLTFAPMPAKKRNPSARLFPVVLGCALAMAACSGDGDHKCAFSACGGDPVGSWYGEWICPDHGFSSGIGGVDDEPDCEGAVSVDDVAFDLALKLDPYDQFVYQGTTLVYWTMTWTPKCLNALNGTKLSPDQVTQICNSYTTELTSDPASTFTSGSCTMDGAGVCNCTAVQAGNLDEKGGYYASGGKIFMDSGYKLDYCVKGNTLEVRDNRNALGPMVERLKLL
jgi:hypothetical protein